MPAAFLVSTSTRGIPALLERAALPSNRIEVVYWGGTRSPRWEPSPVVRVSLGRLSGLLAVQQACQALISGDAGTALAINAREVFLLASPEAVGRYNLAPRAQVIGRFLYSSHKDALRSGLRRLEITPQEVDRVSLAGFSQEEANPLPFTASQTVFQQGKPGLIPVLKSLEERRQKYGLLLALGENGTTCGILLERI
ncbi:MAG: hypothetical protein M1281_01860 [Chloroflexi bacterium]|nr:hypothetical protein [Chloroflexota bacterium]